MMAFLDWVYLAAQIATPIIIVRNWKAIVWCFRVAVGLDDA